MPTEAALRPVASATRPRKMIANGNPLPAVAVVSPSAAKRPVPIIMAAVRNVAVVGPKLRFNDGLGSVFGCALAASVMYSLSSQGHQDSGGVRFSADAAARRSMNL